MGDLSLRQRHERSCGATCIAFITGLSLDEVEKVNGTKGTSTKKLARTLRALGFDCYGVLRHITDRQRPAPGDIVKIRWDFTKTNWHWVVKLDSGYFDPLYGQTTDAFYAKRRGRATSFLPVIRPDGAEQAA